MGWERQKNMNWVPWAKSVPNIRQQYELPGRSFLQSIVEQHNFDATKIDGMALRLQ